MTTKVMTLLTRHCSEAQLLSLYEIEQVAAPLVEKLRALSCPGDRDSIGIPHRARPVYEDELAGTDAPTLAALRRYLLNHNAYGPACDACENVPTFDPPRVPAPACLSSTTITREAQLVQPYPKNGNTARGPIRFWYHVSVNGRRIGTTDSRNTP